MNSSWGKTLIKYDPMYLVDFACLKSGNIFLFMMPCRENYPCFLWMVLYLLTTWQCSLFPINTFPKNSFLYKDTKVVTKACNQQTLVKILQTFLESKLQRHSQINNTPKFLVHVFYFFPLYWKMFSQSEEWDVHPSQMNCSGQLHFL